MEHRESPGSHSKSEGEPQLASPIEPPQLDGTSIRYRPKTLDCVWHRSVSLRSYSDLDQSRNADQKYYCSSERSTKTLFRLTLTPSMEGFLGVFCRKVIENQCDGAWLDIS